MSSRIEDLKIRTKGKLAAQDENNQEEFGFHLI
jgi:hypothetical protein